MLTSPALRDARERIVREHMAAENALDSERALATFSRPRYELIGTGVTHDGPEDVARYYRESRRAFPDQRNEIISLRHADDAVIWSSGCWGRIAGGWAASSRRGGRFARG